LNEAHGFKSGVMRVKPGFMKTTDRKQGQKRKLGKKSRSK
jgi:hypothetical protein